MFVLEAEKKEFATLKEVADYLGRKQVARRDMARLGIIEQEDASVVDKADVDNAVKADQTQVTADQVNDAVVADDKKDEKPEEPAKAKESTEAPKAKKKEKEEKPDPTKDPVIMANAEKLQQETGFTDITEWAIAMKQMEAQEVIDLAKGIGLDWTENNNPRINRMRAVQTLREALFPGQKRPRVRRSKWRGVDLEKLIEIAKKNKIEYRETIDEKITRMWLIKALNEAGIEPPTV